MSNVTETAAAVKDADAERYRKQRLDFETRLLTRIRSALESWRADPRYSDLEQTVLGLALEFTGQTPPRGGRNNVA